MIGKLLARQMNRELRQRFRRLRLVGNLPQISLDQPVVLYSNHHGFYDGHALRVLLARMERRSITWMEEWDRFPLFAAVGAFPFPAENPQRRAKTVLATRNRLERQPASGLIYFPEGVLHPLEEGILGMEDAPLRRISRVLGEPVWLPVAMRVRWFSEARPSLFLAAGVPHAGADGSFGQRLSELWEPLAGATVDAPGTTLLDGEKSAGDWMNLGFTARFFRRYLR